MKTSLYILGSLAFGALILINKPLPEEPSKQFVEKRNEMRMKEDSLNQSIIKVENELAENKVLLQIRYDSIKVTKK